eukprot:m.515675 g.515675  ORF g.515675 m.515675 type:complete len:355 (+) comp21923_c0_seq14:2241-3305(+)
MFVHGIVEYGVDPPRRNRHHNGKRLRVATRGGSVSRSRVGDVGAMGCRYKERKKDAAAPYRANDRVFSIEDADGLEQSHHAFGKGGGADLDLAGAINRNAKNAIEGDLIVFIDKLRKQPAVKHVFKCSEVSLEGYLFPSHIVLTSSHILKLRDRSSKEAIVLARRHLSRIARITAKKKHPNLLTLVFETEKSDTGGIEVTDSPIRARAPSSGAAEDSAEPAAPTGAGGDNSASATTPVPAVIPSFSIGGDDDDDDRDPDSPAPADDDGTGESTAASSASVVDDATTPTPSGGTDPNTPSPGEGVADNAMDSPNPPAADSKEESAVIEIKEMFMIPESTEAKLAFKDAILALPRQ